MCSDCKCDPRDPRGFEIMCFVFAASFVLAAGYYAPHGIDTALAWIITSIVTFVYAFIVRQERLKSDAYPYVKDTRSLGAAQLLVVVFLVWSISNMIIAIMGRDGIEPESRWMTFIATMMGLKWSAILTKCLMRIQDDTNTASQNIRALLSPIGEIA